MFYVFCVEIGLNHYFSKNFIYNNDEKLDDPGQKQKDKKVSKKLPLDAKN